jgi:hypothetical protein
MDYPAYAVRYLSYELVQALGELSEQQQQVIVRVVLKDKYAGGRTLIPWKYIGTNKLVSAQTYSGRGWQDETGAWHDVGWHHQAAFRAAVALAKRAVLEAAAEEGLADVQRATGRARAKLARLTGVRIGMAEDEGLDAQHRLKAIADNEKLALLGVTLPGQANDEQAGEGTLEADWWKAAAE